MALTESEKNLRPETIREEIVQRVEKLLENKESSPDFKCGALDLETTKFYEWEDRPVIDEESEPLTIKGKGRILLIEIEGEGISVQLRVAPAGGEPRERQVYNLDLHEGGETELITCIDKPVGVSSGNEPAPMFPYNLETREASVGTLQAFSKFLEQGKAAPQK
jgi:hypothetical protein